MKSLGVKIAIIMVLTVLAGWLRLANLGAVNLYNDEYYQFETAVGWLRLGEWVRYDYYEEAAGKPYDRAKIFIVQVAASIRMFGETEAAGRLPAALWGTLLIPVTILCLLIVVRRPWIAYGTGLVLVFDELSIGLSRYVRMYSMLMVLLVILVTLVYLLLECTGWKKRLWYGMSSALVLCLSLLIFKELTLAIIGAIGIYALMRSISFVITRNSADRPWLMVWCIGALGGVIAIGLTLLGYNIVPLDAIIIRTNPHWSYITELFNDWRVPAIAAGFAFVGTIVALRQLRSYMSFAAVISLVVLIYFAFLSHRWDAQRYISIVVPFIALITTAGMVASIRFLFALLPQPVWLRWTLLVPLVCLVGPWITLPGVPGNNFTHQTATADRSTTELGYADMQTAYAYVASRISPGEVVLMQGPRFYYWPDQSVPVYLLGGYKSLSLAEFKALAQRGTSGGWVVFNVTHQRHLQDNIKTYMSKRFEYIPELSDTNVVVYHFVPADLVTK